MIAASFYTNRRRLYTLKQSESLQPTVGDYRPHVFCLSHRSVSSTACWFGAQMS
jgi:hypothetical protein